MLEALSRDDLSTIADRMGLEMRQYSRRKKDYVYRILEAQFEREGQVFRAGVLEILDEGGYGFLRGNENYLASMSDVYVSQSQVRRFGLRTGDYVTGTVRAPKDNEKYYSLLRVEAVNGLDPEVAKRRPHFEQLTAVFPDELIDLETSSDNLTQRMINLVAPIGRGQRGLIVSPPKAGKTFVLKNIANGISQQLPRHPPHGAAHRRAAGRGHRHAALRRWRSRRLDLRRAGRGPRPRRRDGARARQAAGRGRQRRRHPARLASRA